MIQLLQLSEEKDDVISPLVTPNTSKKRNFTLVVRDFLYGFATFYIDSLTCKIYQYYINYKHIT